MKCEHNLAKHAGIILGISYDNKRYSGTIILEQFGNNNKNNE